jgi:malate dehydrogenase (oxaloacetate-decarboxylating)(NADP+)
MQRALALIRERLPELEIDGEMHADAALFEEVRARAFPASRLAGTANLLVMPSLDAAHIAFNLVRAVEQAVSIGPILMGAARPAHIVTSAVTVRGLVNMSAVACVDAQMARAPSP